jgi:hypothetical protein
MIINIICLSIGSIGIFFVLKLIWMMFLLIINSSLKIDQKLMLTYFILIYVLVFYIGVDAFWLKNDIL